MKFTEKEKELLLDKGYMILNSREDGDTAMRRSKQKTSLLIRINPDRTFTIYASQVEGTENESFRSDTIEAVIDFGNDYF